MYHGDLVTEIHQTFTNFVSQVIRLYSDENFIEFDWVVGPLNIGEEYVTFTNTNLLYSIQISISDHGKEVITKFSTPLESNSVFYTDSNGREMLERTRNFRPTWDIEINETESSNYYPVTSRIVIKDQEKNLEFAVLTDRAQGGSSLRDGEVELMVIVFRNN